jgi:hypothetical protein
MRFDEWKRWHWVIAGLLIGALLAYSHLDAVSDELYSTGPTPFERWLDPAARRATDPIVQTIVIFPVTDLSNGQKACRVEFDALYPVEGDATHTQFKPRKGTVSSTVPYYPRLPTTTVVAERGDDIYALARRYLGTTDKEALQAILDSNKHTINDDFSGVRANGRYLMPPRATPSIREYLETRIPAIQAQYRVPITLRYAWWTVPWAVFAIWGGGTLVLIGGVWPTVLNLMLGAGLGPPPRPAEEYDVDRFGKGTPDPSKTKLKPRSEWTAEEMAQLQALEKTVASGAAPAAEEPVAAAARSVEVRKLEATAEPAAPPEERLQKTSKDFQGGVYYPVSVPKPETPKKKKRRGK